MDIGLGREKKTTVNVFYREFTGGVSRDNSLASQTERYSRQINQWREISESRRDYILLGDNNLCAKSWHDADYDADRRRLASMMTDFLLEESAVQLVEDFTRSELVNNNIQRSCIDHVITNIPGKCEKPHVSAIGNSDHMAVGVKKSLPENFRTNQIR